MRSEKPFKRDLTREERSVRGILVTGLTKHDMRALDYFEGSVSTLVIHLPFQKLIFGHAFKEYVKQEVRCIL